MVKRLACLSTLILIWTLSFDSQAVRRSADGLGQVLLYPYYTTRIGQATLFSVVNTTDQVKAVNVRLSEGKGGVPVIDFNLYLAPFDGWTGGLVDSGGGARLFSHDLSCTVPAIPPDGAALESTAYAGDNYADDSLDRTREGFAQIIEMGVLRAGPNRLGRFALPGEEMDCGELSAAWNDNGIWQSDPNTDLQPPSGGLLGAQTLINVTSGHAVAIDALALAEFRQFRKHVAPGSHELSLADAAPPVSHQWDGNQLVESHWYNNRIQAVSAVLMSDRVFNEFSVDPITQSATDWVFSQPTKGIHVPPFGGPGIAPYSETPAAGGGQCALYDVYFWDRDGIPTPRIDFSPASRFICWATTVFPLPFDEIQSPVLGSLLPAPGFLLLQAQFGHAEIRLPQSMTSDEGHRYYGLPGFGFAITKYSNGLVDSVQRAYATSSLHSTRMTIEHEPE